MAKLNPKSQPIYANPRCGLVTSHFLDSGSFSLWSIAKKWAEETSNSEWDFYDGDEAFEYLDAYADFVKEFQDGIDLYANVDVIGNPDLSYRNLKYLEGKGLSPVPVVHFQDRRERRIRSTDLKWIEKYIDEGYELIGLGGLVGSTVRDACQDWLDDVFHLICNNSKRLPCIKVHGFGVSSFRLLTNYPWYSVDSTSWDKMGAFGVILCPRQRQGKWDYSQKPHRIKVSEDSPDRKNRDKHVLSMNQLQREIISKWLDEIDMPLGKVDRDTGEEIENGCITNHKMRRAANLLYLDRLRHHLQSWPWAYSRPAKPTLGLWGGKKKQRPPVKHDPQSLIIYYSGWGGGSGAYPEYILRDCDINLMLTYWKSANLVNESCEPRFRKILAVRRGESDG